MASRTGATVSIVGHAAPRETTPHWSGMGRRIGPGWSTSASAQSVNGVVTASDRKRAAREPMCAQLQRVLAKIHHPRVSAQTDFFQRGLLLRVEGKASPAPALDVRVVGGMARRSNRNSFSNRGPLLAPTHAQLLAPTGQSCPRWFEMRRSVPGPGEVARRPGGPLRLQRRFRRSLRSRLRHFREFEHSRWLLRSGATSEEEEEKQQEESRAAKARGSSGKMSVENSCHEPPTRIIKESHSNRVIPFGPRSMHYVCYAKKTDEMSRESKLFDRDSIAAKERQCCTDEVRDGRGTVGSLQQPTLTFLRSHASRPLCASVASQSGTWTSTSLVVSSRPIRASSDSGPSNFPRPTSPTLLTTSTRPSAVAASTENSASGTGRRPVPSERSCPWSTWPSKQPTRVPWPGAIPSTSRCWRRRASR